MTPNPGRKEGMGEARSLLLSPEPWPPPRRASPPTGDCISLAHLQIRKLRPREVWGSSQAESDISAQALASHTDILL